METKRKPKRYFRLAFITALATILGAGFFVLGTHSSSPINFTRDAYWERQEQPDAFRYYLKKQYLENTMLVLQCRNNKFANHYGNGTMVQVMYDGQLRNLDSITLDGINYKLPVVSNETALRDKETVHVVKALTHARIVSFSYQDKSYVWKVNNQTFFSRCNTY